MDLAIPASWRQIFAKTTPTKVVDPETEIPSFEHMIHDAQLLLSYAATVGATLNDADVKILNDEIQKATVDKSGNHNYTEALLAYSRIAKQLLPVTAYTLRECFVSAKRIMRSYARGGERFRYIDRDRIAGHIRLFDDSRLDEERNRSGEQQDDNAARPFFTDRTRIPA